MFRLIAGIMVGGLLARIALPLLGRAVLRDVRRTANLRQTTASL